MAEGRTIKAKRNVFFGILGRIIVIALQFVTRYFFIQYLSVELLGLNGVFSNVIQCLSIAELGINNVAMFSYYKPLANGDTSKIAALNRFYKKLYNIIALVVIVIGLAIIPALPYIINLSTEIDHLYLIYLLYLLDTAVSYFCIYKSILLSADQKGHINIKIETILTIVQTVCQIVSLILFKNYYIFIGLSIAFKICANVLKAVYVTKKYPCLREKQELTIEEKKEIGSTIKSGFIYKLSGVLLNSTDNVLISAMVGTLAVGLLSNYVTITTAIGAFYVIIFTNLTASVGNLIATEEPEKRLKIFRIMLLAANSLSIIVFCCSFALVDDFICVWIGNEYVVDLSIMLPKIIMLYVSCSLQPIFSFREALGLYKKTKWAMLISALINIGLSILFGYFWGVSGILIASLVAVFSTYYWYEPVVLYSDCFKTKPTEYFISSIINMSICAATAVGLFFLMKTMPCYNWGFWILKACICGFTSFVVCILVYFKRPEFKYLIDYIFKSRRKKHEQS